MKNFWKFMVGAIFIGAVLAFFFYKDIKKEVVALSSDDDFVYVFQVGVFNQKENAQEFVKNYQNGQIYQDNLYYRAFVGVTINNQEKLKAYFTNLGYDYYLKKLRIKDSIYQKIKAYDNVLGKSTKSKTIEVLLKEMNALFLESQT